MFVKKSYNKGRMYLSLAEGYRKDGKVKQKTIEKIGYLDELEKIYDDPLEHFKQVAKSRSLSSEDRNISIDTAKRLDDNTNNRKNLGYVVPKLIYSMLDIPAFLQNKQRQNIHDYNLNQIFSLLVFNRCLFPSSKKRAFETKDKYFDRFNFSLDDTYRSLDKFAAYSSALQVHIYNKRQAIVPVDTQLGYYDVTNFYYEIPYNDEDTYDSNGELIKKGKRKKGPSKEHRRTPIVQMGLLMDSNAIPMSFNTFPGNESEKTTILEQVRRLKKDFGMERVIAVADRGLNSSDNTAFLSGVNDDDYKGNDGYVYGQSVLGADKEFKEWVLKKDEYSTSKVKDENGEEVIFIHKSRLHAKKITLKDRKKNRRLPTHIYQKQMVYFSKKYADKQKKEREKTVAKARDLIDNPGRYTSATHYGATAYIKDINFSKDTGEIVDGQDLQLDLEKIEAEGIYDGYYSIVTSEKNLSDKEIRDIYRRLWKIEETFKIMKSELGTRPMYVQLEDHIEAHFLVCFVALVIMRLLEHMTNRRFSIGEMRNSLSSYSCSYLDQNYYLFDYRDDFIKSVEALFNIDLGKNVMKLEEIKNILKAPQKE